MALSPSPSSSTPPPFELPGNWDVELRPRQDGRFDKYYYEPGTGRQFRSLSAIQKYLSGDVDVLPQKRQCRGRDNYYCEPSTGKKFRSLSSIQEHSSGKKTASPKSLKAYDTENMAITSIFKSGPSSKLPKGWVVEEKRRSNINSKLIDKYYYEPGTGRKFRSLSSVQKYLSGDLSTLPKSLKPCDAQNMAISHSIFKRDPCFRLPKGWVVKKKARTSINYEHVVDSTYIEPGTGRQFRSLLSVERYLAEQKALATTPRPHQLYLTDTAEASNPGYRNPPSSFHYLTNCASGSEIEASVLDLGRPPNNVKWVLSPVGSIWKPFVNGAQVPDSVKRKWCQASLHILSYGH